LLVRDAKERTCDVVLGFDTLAEYEANRNLYFGATVGRVANRIAGANFTVDGVDFPVVANDGPNHLHGGSISSFDRVVWEVVAGGEGAASVTFRHVSPHLDEGYPGHLEAIVEYSLTPENGLRIEYHAWADQRTPVNLTHHSYWNLAGSDSGSTIDDHLLTLTAERYTPSDDLLIPLGPMSPVAETPFDFRYPAELGPRIRALADRPSAGLDHNFVIQDWDSTLRHAARLQSPANGVVMDLHTTEPGVQVYTGGHMPSTRGKGGVVYPPRGGVCLEAQHFPDSVHHPEYPNVLLEPGDTYRQTTEYRFSTI
jgi:aldose 1-epimerase